MVFALIVAALATLFLGSSVADWVVAQNSFESSDDAENLHMLVFVGPSPGDCRRLLVGWVIMVAASTLPAPEPPRCHATQGRRSWAWGPPTAGRAA
jgi:hypothetical protein